MLLARLSSSPEIHRRLVRRPLPRFLVALCSAALVGLLVWGGTAAAAAIAGRLSWAADAPLVGAGAAAASLAVAAVRIFWHRRFKRTAALLLASAAAAASVLGIGIRNLTAMAAGVQTGCAAGMGRCEATGRANMPLLLHIGAVQAHPVVRVIMWGVTPAERDVVAHTERVSSMLGQPLLEDYYGVHPALNGGSWSAPGNPRQWLRRHHQSALTPGDLAAVIRRARAAMHWPDTADTQYWLATDLSAVQVGIGAGACADHVQVPGVRGTLVRLPFGSCTLPASRSDPAVARASCRPLAVVAPDMRTPATIQAGIETFIVHEFAEAATDPVNGWTLLVASRCHGDPLLEIADVCEPDGSFISAPAWYTAAGWQPSLLEPPTGGQPARCVNPARPQPPPQGSA